MHAHAAQLSVYAHLVSVVNLYSTQQFNTVSHWQGIMPSGLTCKHVRNMICA